MWVLLSSILTAPLRQMPCLAVNSGEGEKRRIDATMDGWMDDTVTGALVGVVMGNGVALALT